MLCNEGYEVIAHNDNAEDDAVNAEGGKAVPLDEVHKEFYRKERNEEGHYNSDKKQADFHSCKAAAVDEEFNRL